jgi:transposase
LTTKIHAVVDGLGNPIRIHLTGGNVNDIVPAGQLIAGLEAEMTIADKAYDANWFTDLIRKQGSQVVIPPTKNRLDQRGYDKHLYKERHLVECFFAKIKVFRRISTRYDKLAVTFKAAVLIAACMVWLQ